MFVCLLFYLLSLKNEYLLNKKLNSETTMSVKSIPKYKMWDVWWNCNYQAILADYLKILLLKKILLHCMRFGQITCLSFNKNIYKCVLLQNKWRDIVEITVWCRNDMILMWYESVQLYTLLVDKSNKQVCDKGVLMTLYWPRLKKHPVISLSRIRSKWLLSVR